MSKVLAIVDQFGNCKLCGSYKDLRCGVCFNCSPKVSGVKAGNGHILWDKENSANMWAVKEN